VIEPVLARRIRLVGIDVDGTLTDGGLYIGAVDGRQVELKRFDIQDGLAVALLRLAGLPVAIVTGRASEAARLRAHELKVDEFVSDPDGRKLPQFEAILARRRIGWDEVAFVGDDLPDVPLLRRAGLPVAVANAVPEAKALAAHTTSASGGRGAVREFVEAFLTARGAWEGAVRDYLRERDEHVAG
jgi:3-deoxy-D-manno-octulosonate 8-phosphate phosphatase (KDO 8-P phosphatase)